MLPVQTQTLTTLVFIPLFQLMILTMWYSKEHLFYLHFPTNKFSVLNYGFSTLFLLPTQHPLPLPPVPPLHCFCPHPLTPLPLSGGTPGKLHCPPPTPSAPCPAHHPFMSWTIGDWSLDLQFHWPPQLLPSCRTPSICPSFMFTCSNSEPIFSIPTTNLSNNFIPSSPRAGNLLDPATTLCTHSTSHFCFTLRQDLQVLPHDPTAQVQSD